jgi:type IV secretion system protein VirD4
MMGFSTKFGPQEGPGARAWLGYCLLVFTLAALAGLQAATLYFAYMFNDQAALGSARLPWSILQWATAWGANYPREFDESKWVGYLTAGVIAAGALSFAYGIQQRSLRSVLHGSARFAHAADLQDAGLLRRGRGRSSDDSSPGIYVGAWRDWLGRLHYLIYRGVEHVLVLGPTRCGKGVGPILMTLLSWGESVLVLDLKGELAAESSGWRKRFGRNKVLKFEIASAQGSIAWNPLDSVRLETPIEVADVQNLATILFDPNGKGLTNHWDQTAKMLFEGIVLHVLYKRKREGSSATLAYIDEITPDPERPITGLWEEMIQYDHTGHGPHREVRIAALEQANRPADEGGSVLSSLKTHLALFRDPIVAKNTSRSDFNIRHLMHHDDPVTLYIIAPGTDKERLKPFVRFFIDVCIRQLTETLQYDVQGNAVRNYKHPLLIMLDELDSWGKIGSLQDAVAHVAGFGIRIFLAAQDRSQIRATYGADQSLTANCKVVSAYPPAPDHVETAAHLSRMTGQTTAVHEQVTRSGFGLFANTSRVQQQISRPLLTEDEVMRLRGAKKNGQGRITKPGRMMIFTPGCPAVLGEGPLWFKDPIFRRRRAVPPVLVSDVLSKAEKVIVL